MSMTQHDSIIGHYLTSLAARPKPHPWYNPTMEGLLAQLHVDGWRPRATEQPFIAAELYRLVREAMRRVLPYATSRLIRFAPHTIAGLSLIHSGLPPSGNRPAGGYQAGVTFDRRVVPWVKLPKKPKPWVLERYQLWCDERAGGAKLGLTRGYVIAAMDSRWPGLASAVARRGARNKVDLVALLSRHGGRRCARVGEQLHDIMSDPGRTAQELLSLLLARDT